MKKNSDNSFVNLLDQIEMHLKSDSLDQGDLFAFMLFSLESMPMVLENIKGYKGMLDFSDSLPDRTEQDANLAQEYREVLNIAERAIKEYKG